MQPGAAIVDVAVDQGGCIETTHATTHADPIYNVDGIVHYAVANMPGAVARTSTFALNNATMRQGVMIANMGWRKAIDTDATLRLGVNVAEGKVTYEAVAKAHGMDFHPLA
jgi:alanine dehydrogenase